MPRLTGTPTWLEITITDDTTREFYRRLFGWEFESIDGYDLISQGGSLVGGLMNVSNFPELAQQPRTWEIHLAVDDVDARAALALEHGASVVTAPEDAGPAGRYAMVTDPTGANICMWQAGKITGYEFSMAPGTPVWFELMTTDYDRALEFYSAVFDFKIAPMPGGEAGFRYATNGEGASAVCGICDASPWLTEGRPSFWRGYFAVQDTEESVRLAQGSGGTLLDGPAESPFGRFATIADPEGATFQINQSPNPEARA